MGRATRERLDGIQEKRRGDDEPMDAAEAERRVMEADERISAEVEAAGRTQVCVHGRVGCEVCHVPSQGERPERRPDTREIWRMEDVKHMAALSEVLRERINPGTAPTVIVGEALAVPVALLIAARSDPLRNVCWQVHRALEPTEWRIGDASADTTAEGLL